MKYFFELEKSGFYIPKFAAEFKLIELVFEDMATFGEAIFTVYVENVVTGKSKHEEIAGNICSLKIAKNYTLIRSEFVNNKAKNELKFDTAELLKLIKEWIGKNNL